MSWITSTSTATANISLGILNSQAKDLYEQARRYREEMDKLPPNDPQRATYEKIILDLLTRARHLSSTVTNTASSS